MKSLDRLQIRINPEIKAKAEEYADMRGLKLVQCIRIFLVKFVKNPGEVLKFILN